MTDLTAYLSTLQSTTETSAATPALIESAAPATQPTPSVVHSDNTGNFTHPAFDQVFTRSPLSPLAARGKQIFERGGCVSCHGVEGSNGTVAAPGLAGTASLLPESDIEALLRHHSLKMRLGGMPSTNFNNQDMKAIVAYIHSMGLSQLESNSVLSQDRHPKK
jgi:cytochrome c553